MAAAVFIGAAGFAGAQETTPVGAPFGLLPGENMPEDWAPCEAVDADLRGGIEDRLWPNGVVPYAFNSNVSSNNRNRAINAMAEIEAVCNVQFVPRTDETGYIMINSSSSSNSSPVGYSGGSNGIQIASWSWRFIICHELMHSLGINHEQSKPGRGDFITINWDNIQADRDHNFRISGLPVLPYNFESIMHYSRCAFAVCSCSSCPTISAKPGYESMESVMGNRSYMSEGDAGTLAFLYDGPEIGDDAFEPNNSFAAAAPITPGQHDLVMGEWDGDYFEFTLAERSDVTLTTSCEETAFKTTTSILDQSETVLASGTNGWWDDGAPIEATLDAGTYVIRIPHDLGFHAYSIDLDVTPNALCLTDCDGNGTLNIDDVDCFVAAFLAGDQAVADCDGNGTLNIDDVDCFVAGFLAGCP